MSLPKEPRQLMINLMYLVLTAMLALNVSAEILNAFLAMDEGIMESNRIVNRSNDALYQSIAAQANAYPQFEKYNVTANDVKSQVSDFCKYVEKIKIDIIQMTGGVDEFNHPVGKKDKDFTSRFLVDEGWGNKLRDSVLKTKMQLINLIEEEVDQRLLAEKIPLNIKPIPKDSDNIVREHKKVQGAIQIRSGRAISSGFYRQNVK